jgi:hypothetical protein
VILTPFFTGRSLYDFDIVASHISNKLYHLGVRNRLASCLGGIVAILRRQLLPDLRDILYPV